MIAARWQPPSPPPRAQLGGERQVGMSWVAVACTLVAVAVTSIGATGCAPRPFVAGDGQGPRARSGSTVSSNVLRGDYAGSAACAPCHGDVVSTWRRSPMHRMTRLPESTEVRAPFDGRAFRFKDDVARFEQSGPARFLRLQSAQSGEHVYRVTKVIGGRVREDFAGVEVVAAAPGAAVVGDAHAELILPASYVIETASFRLKGYSVMVGERPGMRAGGVWNQTCIFCHNTVPYFDDLWGALHGAGAPGYQGEVVDRALPLGRRLTYAVTDVPALTRALDAETAVLQGRPPAAAAPALGSTDSATDAARAALRGAILTARARFGPEHFVELGIGCEACHGGSRAHAEDPRLRPTFEPRAAFLSVARAGEGGAPPSAAEWQNRACARCHQVLFSRYPRTWEGGSRRGGGDAGGSHITSGEGRDFLLGGCASAMTCTTCHDPHGQDGRERLARLATAAGNGVCTGCHQKLGGATALRAHAHHEPTGAGASCVACHMPKKNMGLGYALTRYHRIGSPTDRERVERDRPLECALCHADRSVGSLLNDIARLWGRSYDPAAILRLYGSTDANVLVATIERGFAHEQAAAIGAAGEHRLAAASRAVAREIERNTYPLVRYHATAALAAIEGRPVPTDIHGDGATAVAGHGVAAPPARRDGVGAERGDDED